MIKQLIKRLVFTKEDNLLSHAFSAMPFKDEIALVDIGAAGDLEPRWKKIEKHLVYYGFEPDSRSYKELEEKPVNVKRRKLFQTALWDSARSLEFNMCSKPQVSSHFFPNFSFLDRFPDIQRFGIDYKSSLECIALDDLEISPCDFIKIDVQGGELAILQGASKTLENAFGIEAEIEFIKIYEEQPLFGEVTNYLTGLGFELIDFTGTCRWERESHNEVGQLVFGDALFLKSPETVINNCQVLEKKATYLKILLIYRRFDLIDKFLKNLDVKDRNTFHLFKKKIIPLNKKFNRARQVSRFCSRMLNIFGLNYKSHLIY